MSINDVRKKMFEKMRLDSEANPQESFRVSKDSTPIIGHSLRYLFGLSESVSDLDFAKRVIPSHSGEIPSRPFLILTRTDMRPHFSSYRREEYLMNIHIYTNDETMKLNGDIEDRLIDLFENKPLTIGGEKVIGERMTAHDLSDFVPGIYHTNISFVYTTTEEFSDKNY